MQIKNILMQLQATDAEFQEAQEYFRLHKVSYNAVRGFLDEMRGVLS